MTHPNQYLSTKVKSEIDDKLEDFYLIDCPYKTFTAWYNQSAKSELNVDAMSVATVDQRGVPRNRYLLYKGITNSCFIFYTNYLSQKACDLDKNPNVSLNFFWPTTKFQIRITGTAKRSAREMSVKYFSSRDRESQLASAASSQSSPIKSREVLLDNIKQLAENCPMEIPCPETWGGYLLEPNEFEFFIYGSHRINDRFLFKKNGGDWILTRLQP